eukprot:c24670_g1_i1 orf=957-5213(-)
MKENTVLDYVELQLSSPSSSRCELFISAEGETEKLACGFLMTFLTHVRAAQELHAAGAQPTLRLEGPHVFNGSRRPWFTKGTLERFVQYVSTPEVLERVKIIEDELAQLEQVRSIQAGSLAQVNDAFLSTNPTVLRAGAMPAEYHLGHCQYSAVSSEAEDSKRELLRAMDARLAALQQEQNMVFCRAAAAGFDVESIEDLLAFSEYFGADRLRVACSWFFQLSAKWQRAVQHGSQELPNQANFLSSNANQEIETGSPWRTSRANVTCDSGGVQIPTVEDTVLSNHCTSPTQSMPNELAAVSPVRRSQNQGNMNKNLPQRASPRRRSASPLKKVQVGRFGSRRSGSVVIRSINYFSSHDRPNKERNNIMETSSSDSEDNIKSYNLDEPASAITSSPAAARRLSVQAAINLFESKHPKEIGEAGGKQKSLKQESRRGSLEGADTSTLDLSLYGEVGSSDVSCSGLQDRGISFPSLDSECISDNYRRSMERVVRSPGRFVDVSNHANVTGLLSEFDSEELLGWQQSTTGQNKLSSPREAPDLRRALSTSEDLVASELNSVGGSPLARGMHMCHEFTDCDISSTRSTVTSVSRGGACVEKSSMCVDSRPYRPTPTSPVSAISSVVNDSQNNQGQTSQKSFKEDSSLVQNGPSFYICEEGSIDSKFNVSRDCVTPSDLSIQALASLADCLSVKEEIPGRNEGRFYEQYRKLRDAKMMEEQQSKRAEREAKLRLMEETLDLRKAEMDARTAKLNKDNCHARARATNLHALKANAGEMQRVQEDAVVGQSNAPALLKDCSRSDSSPPSPPLTPRVAKEQALTPKLHRAKKAVAASQKSATTPQSSTRAASVSPKTTPRGTAGKSSSHRSSVSSNMPENPLACSVPCFSDLKKENTKPSPGKPSGSARVHSKNGGGHAPVTSRASLSESNGGVPFQSSLSNKTARVDRKNRAWQARQSYATSELKGLSTASEDEIPNAQKDSKIETPVLSKIRRSAVAPIQEARPFLRKGTGIGPGAGPGVMKLKADAVKSSDEDAPGTPLKNSDEEAPTISRNIADTSDGENMTIEEGTGAKMPTCLSFLTSEEKEVEAEALVTSDVDATHHSDGGLFALCKEVKLDKLCKDDELLENERACHTISFPIDFVTHERYAATFASETDPVSQEPRVDVVRREGEANATLSQLLSEGASQVLQNQSSVNGSSSFRATLSTDEHTVSRFSPMKAASLASSSLKRLGATIPEYFSPSSAATLVESSPLASPASWNSSQVQYASETDAKRLQKKSGSSQTPVVVVMPPKEPAKGLKRLLKFARKSRAAPEITVTDGVSASTPSEGDDDFEEVKGHSANDLLRKVKLQERLLKDFGIAGLSNDHGNTQGKGSNQSLQSAVPIPPSNFKLKYDHAPGSSKLKAPRSFFSLSTFRSRGSEGKSR